MLHHVSGSEIVVMSLHTLSRTLKHCSVYFCNLISTIIYFYKNNFIFFRTCSHKTMQLMTKLNIKMAFALSCYVNRCTISGMLWLFSLCLVSKQSQHNRQLYLMRTYKSFFWFYEFFIVKAMQSANQTQYQILWRSSNWIWVWALAIY